MYPYFQHIPYISTFLVEYKTVFTVENDLFACQLVLAGSTGPFSCLSWVSYKFTILQNILEIHEYGYQFIIKPPLELGRGWDETPV